MPCNSLQDFSPIMPRVKRGFSDSFTLLELLVVVGILSVLGTVTFVALNPIETLKKTRDEQRYQELTTLDKAAHMYEADAQSISEGSANTVYISLPDTSSSCASWTLPPLPSGQAYHCVTSANLYNVDGTGWVPIAFSSISYGTPLTKLPIDPTNNVTYYYTYMTSGNGAGSMFTALAEAQSHDPAIGDGGRMPGVYEKGGNLALGPFDRDQGLVGYYGFEEGSGGTINDSTIKGNSMAWTGTGVHYNTNAKVSSYAGQFNGTDDSASKVFSPGLTAPVSVFLWVYPTDNTVSHCAVSRPSNGWFPTYGLCPYEPINEVLNTTDGKFGIYAQTTEGYGADMLVKSNVSLPINTWSYIGFTYDGASFTLYYNGQATSKTLWCKTGSCNETETYLSSGSYQTHYLGIAGDAWKSNNFQGVMDDVRFYNRVLSSSEVQAIYGATK